MSVSISSVSNLQNVVNSVCENEINVKSPNGTFVPVRNAVVVDAYSNSNDDREEVYGKGCRVIPPSKESEFLSTRVSDLHYPGSDSKSYRAFLSPYYLRGLVLIDKDNWGIDYSAHGFILIGDIWVDVKNAQVVEHATAARDYDPHACIKDLCSSLQNDVGGFCNTVQNAVGIACSELQKTYCAIQ